MLIRSAGVERDRTLLAGRPDITAFYGDQFTASGFGLSVRHLAAGSYDLAIFAWSDAEGRYLPAKIVRITVR